MAIRGSAKKRRFVKLIEETYFKVFSKDAGDGEVHFKYLEEYIRELIQESSSEGGSGVFDPDLPDELEASFEIGGIPTTVTVGDLRGKTFEELWVMGLFSAVAPSYTAPTASLSTNLQTLIEVGDNFQGEFTATFNQNNGGEDTAYELQKSAVLLSTNNPYTENITQPSPITIPYRGLFTYEDGPILNDSNGNPNPSGQIMAGSVFTNIVNLQWIYPYFWGTSAANTGINYTAGNKVIQNIGANISINFNATEQYLWFAVPDNTPDFSSWFVTALNQGDIGLSSDLFNAPVVEQLTSPQWTDVGYKIYISNFVTTVNQPMQIS